MQGVWLASYVVLWLCVLLLGVVVVLLLRQFGLQFLSSPGALVRDGLSAGTVAPRFAAEDLEGTEHHVGGEGPRTLLVFGSPHCRPCRQLVPALNVFAAQQLERLRVLFVCSGRYEAISRFAESTGIAVPVVSGGDNTIASMYRARVTPFGFLLDEAGVIVRKAAVNGRPHLDWLLLGDEVPGTVEAPGLSEGLPGQQKGGDAVPEADTNGRVPVAAKA